MKTTRTSGDSAVLILFCVFIMSVFTALALGVGTYQNITAASRQGHDERIGLSYIWTKVKTGDEAGKVHAGDFHGLSALFIDEEHGGVSYRTAIYHYNGWIYELFFEAGYDHLPRDGVPVARNGSFHTERLDNGAIKVSVGPESVLILPRAG